MAADRFSYEIAGLSEAFETIGELRKNVQRDVLKRALTQAAEPIRAEAERLAPYDPDGGDPHLRDHIVTKVSVRTARAEARIGFEEDTFQGIFQELGTEHHPAQPFLRPAIDAKQGEAGAVFGRAMRDEIHKSVARRRRKLARQANG